MANPAKFDRDNVLYKAMMLFWGKGFNTTSTRDLQDELDMRPGSVYAAFGSKKGLFKESLTLYVEQVSEQIDTWIREEDNIVLGLKSFFKDVSLAKKYNQPTNLCMLSRAVHENFSDEDINDSVRKALKKLENKYDKLLNLSLEKGEIVKPDNMTVSLGTYLQVQLMGHREFSSQGASTMVIEQSIDDIFNRIIVK